MHHAQQPRVPAAVRPFLYSEMSMLLALGLGITIVQSIAFMHLWRQVLVQNILVTVLGTTFIISGLALLGLYGPRLLSSRIEQNIRIGIVLSCAALLTSIIVLHANADFITAGSMLAFYIFGSIVLIMSRRKLLQSPITATLIKRVLILGAGKKAVQLMDEIAPVNNGAEIIGYLHQPGERERLPTQKVIYLRETLVSYATKVGAHEIVVAVDDRRNNFPMQQLLACKLAGIDIIDSTYFCERELQKMKINAQEMGWLIFSNSFGPTENQKLAKRIFDLTLSSLLLICSLPVWLLLLSALVCRRGFTQSIFARKQMLGYADQPFTALTFAAAKQGDCVDKLIDRLHCRSLPLLLNILMGQLSFVGPQAHAAEILDELLKSANYVQKRNVVKPGIVGWAQLHSDLIVNKDTIATLLEYDLYYIKNSSLLFDLVVLFSGLQKMLQLRQKAPQGRLTEVVNC